MAFAPINDGGLASLFEGLTPFGTSIPAGILTADQEDKLRKQSLISGLIGTAATYAATPKNLGAGSPLPYLGKAFLGGMGSSQDTINTAINNAYRQQLLAARDDKLYNVDGALVDKAGKVVYQAPAKEKEVKTQLIDVGNKKILIDEASGVPIKEFSVTKQPKEVNYTVQTDASGKAVYVPDVPGLPVLDQTGKAVSYTPALSPDQAKRQEKLEKAKEIPDLLKEAESLLPKATGSGLGAVRDIAAATVGQSTEGAKNLASLKYIQSQLILKMPRLEGPQGVLDLKLYESAAADIGNPFVPADTKKAALDTIKRLSNKYNLDETQNQSAQQTNVQTPTSTFKEGAKTKSKSGKPMIFRNGQWEYE